jgi:hypothetical protein
MTISIPVPSITPTNAHREETNGLPDMLFIVVTSKSNDVYLNISEASELWFGSPASTPFNIKTFISQFFIYY